MWGDSICPRFHIVTGQCRAFVRLRRDTVFSTWQLLLDSHCCSALLSCPPLPCRLSHVTLRWKNLSEPHIVCESPPTVPPSFLHPPKMNSSTTFPSLSEDFCRISPLCTSDRSRQYQFWGWADVTCRCSWDSLRPSLISSAIPCGFSYVTAEEFAIGPAGQVAPVISVGPVLSLSACLTTSLLWRTCGLAEFLSLRRRKRCAVDLRTSRVWHDCGKISN